MLQAREACPPGYEVHEPSTHHVLRELSRLLAQVPTTHKRSAVAALLASFAHEAGAPEYVDILAVALHPSGHRSHRSANFHDTPSVAVRSDSVGDALTQTPPAAPRPTTNGFRPGLHVEAPSRSAS